MTQALESLHRRLLGGQYVSDAEYKAVRKAILRAVPTGTREDLRNALQARLRYGNDLFQRRRFEELVELIGPQAAVFIDVQEDFVDRVVAQRNFLTHDVPDRIHPPMDVHDMYRHVLRLRALLGVLLLREIGISPDQSAEAIRNARWFKSFVS